MGLRSLTRLFYRIRSLCFWLRRFDATLKGGDWASLLSFDVDEGCRHLPHHMVCKIRAGDAREDANEHSEGAFFHKWAERYHWFNEQCRLTPTAVCDVCERQKFDDKVRYVRTYVRTW
ncbi:MAG: hypothetical protein GY740_19585 [Gammaproteobacteria bacterium]|nr:hypothetical protein [Gammaproteobacteria bacterium]